MGILGNYSVLHKSPGIFRAGTIASGDRSNFNKSGPLRNRFAGDMGLGMAKFSGIPSGYSHPGSWSMAQSSGGLASYNQLSASISGTEGLLALGINIDASLSATMTDTQAILALIVALIADLSASGSISDANMAIILLLESALSASGGLTDAQLQVIVGLAASLVASGTLTNSITTLVNISADIGGAPELSPAGLVAELLDGQEIEGGFTMRESLRVIMTALAGKLSGGGTSTITIRDVNDLRDRIIATVDSNGNRTAITYDTEG